MSDDEKQKHDELLLDSISDEYMSVTESDDIRPWFFDTFPNLERDLEWNDLDLLKYLKNELIQLYQRNATPPTQSMRASSDLNNAAEGEKLTSNDNDQNNSFLPVVGEHSQEGNHKLKSEIEELKSEPEEKESDYKILKSKIEELQSELEEKKREYKILQSTNDLDHATLESSQGYVQSLEEKLKTDKIKHDEELKSLQKKLDKKEVMKENLEKSVRSLKTDLKSAKDDKQNLEESINSKNSELEKMKRDLESSQQTNTIQESSMKELKDDKRDMSIQITSMETKIANMTRDIKAKTDLLERGKPQMRLSSHLLMHTENLSNMLKTEQMLREEVDASYQSLQTEKANLKSKLDRLETDTVPTYQNQVKTLSEKLNAAEADIKRISTDWDKDRNNLKIAMEKVTKLQTELHVSNEKLKDKDQTLEKQYEKLAVLKGEYNSLNTEKVKIEGKMAEFEKEIAKKNEAASTSLTTIENLKNEMKRKNENISSLQKVSFHKDDLANELKTKNQEIQELKKELADAKNVSDNLMKELLPEKNPKQISSTDADKEKSDQQVDLKDSRSNNKGSAPFNNETATTDASEKAENSDLDTENDVLSLPIPRNMSSDQTKAVSNSPSQKSPDSESNKLTGQPTISSSTTSLQSSSKTITSSSGAGAETSPVVTDQPKFDNSHKGAHSIANMQKDYCDFNWDINDDKQDKKIVKEISFDLNGTPIKGNLVLKNKKNFEKFILVLKLDYLKEYKKQTILINTTVFSSEEQNNQIIYQSPSVKICLFEQKDKSLAEFCTNKGVTAFKTRLKFSKQ